MKHIFLHLLGCRCDPIVKYGSASGQILLANYADGSLKSKTDRNGLVTNYTYDVHGRKLAQNVSTINISYTYDNNGNQLTITDITGTTTRTYDELNTVTSKTVHSIGKSTYVYDIITDMSPGIWGESTTDPKNNVTTKIYDKTGRSWKVTVGDKTTTYNYFDNGSRQSVVYPDGAKEIYTYYKDNLTKTLENIKADGTTIIDSYAYTYDNAHNMLTKVDGKGTTSYVYDVLNRLQKATEPGSGKITSYIFDAAGNRASETVIAAGITVTNGYNGEGYRTSKDVNGVVTKYLYEYDKVVLEVDGSGDQTARNVYGTNLLTRIIGTDTLYYMYNGHGDVTALVDTNKVVRVTYYYDAFGNPVETKFYDANGNLTANGVNNPITFAGYQYDKETGLYYLNARMYDPKIASFLQEDSYRGEADDPLSLNLYAYCSNEPLMYSDPTGHWKWADNAKNWVSNKASDAWDGVKSGADAALSFTASTVGETVNSLVYKPLYTVGKLAGEIQNKTSGKNDITNATESFKKNNIDVTVNWFNSLGSNKKAHSYGKTTGTIIGTGLEMYTIGKYAKGFGLGKGAVPIVKNGLVNFASASISTGINGYADGESGNQILQDSAMAGLMGVGIGAAFDSIPYLMKGLSNGFSNLSSNINNVGMQPAFATSYGTSVNGFNAFNQAINEVSKIGSNYAPSAANGYMSASNGGGSSAPGVDKAGVQPYEVGTFNELQKKSLSYDNLDLHHAAQKHPAAQIIEGYNKRTAPAIAIPKEMHELIPTSKGTFNSTARDLLAKDIQDLRNYTNAPNSSLRELINLNKQLYPKAFKKVNGGK